MHLLATENFLNKLVSNLKTFQPGKMNINGREFLLIATEKFAFNRSLVSCFNNKNFGQ